MNSLYVFNISSKVGGMIDFVLEQNSSDLIANELRWLNGIVGLHEEVIME